MKIEVELPDAIATEVRAKDRRIDTLEKKLAKVERRNAELEKTFGMLKQLRDVMLDAADLLDPYRYEDD